MIILKCKVCKKQFNSFPSLIKEGHKYCSRKCYITTKIGKKLSKEHKIKIGIAIKKLGIYPTPRNQKGRNNAYWRGGRVITERGYILIHNPNHPLCNASGYVFEHRLVMEQYLRRYLKREEVVHHINECLSDNRIENLMLFANDRLHLSYHHKFLNR